MPRRRSRSRRKNSGECKAVGKSKSFETKDDLNVSNCRTGEHCSRKEKIRNPENELEVTKKFVKSQEMFDGVTMIKDPIDVQSIPHQFSDSTLSTSREFETGVLIGDNRHLNKPENEDADLPPNKSSEDLDISRPKCSRVSKGRKLFESRKEKSEDEEEQLFVSPKDASVESEDCDSSFEGNDAKENLPLDDLDTNSVTEGKTEGSDDPKRIKLHLDRDKRDDPNLGVRQNDQSPRKAASPADIPPEGTDDATRFCSEEKSPSRLRRNKRSKSTEKKSSNVTDLPISSNECNESEVSKEKEGLRLTKEEIGKDTEPKPNDIININAKQENSSSCPSSPPSENEGKTDDGRKVSVFEIKRRFSCPGNKLTENNKLKIAPTHLEPGIFRTDDAIQGNKDRVKSAGMAGVCTTELYISAINGKESSTASFLSAAESNSSFADDKTFKLKPKSLHTASSNDEDKHQDSAEVKNTNLEEREASKLSVKQLKERLIWSCSDISEKVAETKQSDSLKGVEKALSCEETENHGRGYEKEEFSVSVKERMETYKCQASKAFYNIPQSYNEQELPTSSSIKELQSSFNRLNQSSTSTVNNVNRSKVKTISEDIAQMQNFSMRCKACGKQVFFMERVMAEKATWHKQCFRCKECKKQLTVENYKSKDGDLYCQSHYMSKMKPKPTDETVSASSVIEEVRIPPLNLKPIFERNQNSTTPSPPVSPPSVERSPKFLKRLAKFEGKYLADSEEEEENEQEKSGEDNRNNNPDQVSKSDDLETYLAEESLKRSTSREQRCRKKKSHTNGSSKSTLHVHLKQFFDKSPEETEVTEENPGPNKSLSECMPGNDFPKKQTPCPKIEDKSGVGDGQTTIARIGVDENDTKQDNSEVIQRMQCEDGRPINVKYKHTKEKDQGDVLLEHSTMKEVTFPRSFENNFVVMNVKMPKIQFTINDLKSGHISLNENNVNDYPTKVSVRELKRRLNSACASCTNITEGKESDTDQRNIEKYNSEGCIPKLSEHRSDLENLKISFKDKMESYQSQVSKTPHVVHICEEKFHPKTSIKELQSNFGKAQTYKNKPDVAKCNKAMQKKDQKGKDLQYCRICGQPVYLMERIVAENYVWHKKCFRCRVCQKQLTLENFKTQNGELFCSMHYKEKCRLNDIKRGEAYVLKSSESLKSNVETKGSSVSSKTVFCPEKSSAFLKRLAIFDQKYAPESESTKSNITEDSNSTSSLTTLSTDPDNTMEEQGGKSHNDNNVAFPLNMIHKELQSTKFLENTDYTTVNSVKELAEKTYVINESAR